VTVRQTDTLRPSNAGRTKSVARNTSVVFTALVRPARSDVPPGTVTFEVYRLVGSSWRRVASRDVVPNATGTATTTVAFNAPGRWYVRSIARPTPVNANSIWTPAEQFRVL
jgi:hypothetical protein